MTVSGLLVRYLIDTPGMPGMTAQQPPEPHDATAQYTVTLHGSDGVTGTGRVETAVVTQPGTEQQTVTAY